QWSVKTGSRFFTDHCRRWGHRTSTDNVLDHVALDVGQPHVAAGVAVGQLLVIQAEQVQDGSVPVVDVHLPLAGLGSLIIDAPVGEAALGAAAGHPGGEAPAVVVAAV